MKFLLFTLIVLIFGSTLFVSANDCALSCFSKYLKCMDQVHPGGRCRAEERLCFINDCNFDPATKACIEKCDIAFQNCPVTEGVKCIEAEKQCYTDC